MSVITVAPEPPDCTPELTPIVQYGNIWMKRDDLFCIGGIRGGKVRACWALATQHNVVKHEVYTHAPGLVTASARKSPQMQIVARIAKRLGIPARLHTASGPATVEMLDATKHGGTLVQHKPGYNSVIMARAAQDAIDRRWTYIPFGMECTAAMRCTRNQVKEIPEGVKRIVVVLGSGMSACGILWGLQDLGRDIPVLGIRIGADPLDRITEYAPQFWQHRLCIERSEFEYATPCFDSIAGVQLDPHYEAKCVRYLRGGDLFWVVGIRAGITV